MTHQMQPQSGQTKRERTPFEAVLAPLYLEQFLSEAFGKEPLHLRGVTGRFRSFLDWQALARLLEAIPLEPPRLSVIKGGKAVPGERYLRRLGSINRIDSGSLSLLLDAGATAIINHIDDLIPAIAVLADDVGDCLGARTAVNLYATWRSERGFDPHWDHHDVIVLQLAGRKEWKIHKPTRPDPLRGDAFDAPLAGEPPELTKILEDGDVLYLPRGWIHAPVPVDEPSLHLTIAITRPTGAGFFSWLASELKANPQVRAAIPAAWEEAPLIEWKACMSALIQAAIEGNAVDRYIAQKDAERGARPHFSFPDFGRTPHSEWNGTTMLRPASLHRFVVETAADGSAQLTALGRAWPCSPAVAAVLGDLTSTRPLTLGALEAELIEEDAVQLRQLLGMLATFGLLASTSADPGESEQ